MTLSTAFALDVKAKSDEIESTSLYCSHCRSIVEIVASHEEIARMDRDRQSASRGPIERLREVLPRPWKDRTGCLTSGP